MIRISFWAFTLLISLGSFGQQNPTRKLSSPLYTLQIEPARDPSSTSTAQGERLLQCKGCTFDEFTQQFMKPHRVQFEKRAPRTKYDFQLNWKQGELAIHQQDLIRQLAKAFDFTTTQTPKPMEVQRLIVTQPERAYKTTDEDDSGGQLLRQQGSKVYFYNASISQVAQELSRLTGALHEAASLDKRPMSIVVDLQQLDESLSNAGLKRTHQQKSITIYTLK